MPLKIAVNFPAVAHLHNNDHQDLISNLIYDSVFSYPQSEEISVPTESNCAHRTRIVGEGSNAFVHSFSVLGWKGCDFTPGGGKDFEAVGQSRPNSFRACS